MEFNNNYPILESRLNGGILTISNVYFTSSKDTHAVIKLNCDLKTKSAECRFHSTLFFSIDGTIYGILSVTPEIMISILIRNPELDWMGYWLRYRNLIKGKIRFCANCIISLRHRFTICPVESWLLQRYRPAWFQYSSSKTSANPASFYVSCGTSIKK